MQQFGLSVRGSLFGSILVSAAITSFAHAQQACTVTGFTGPSQPVVGNAFGTNLVAAGDLVLIQDAAGGYEPATGLVWPSLATLELGAGCSGTVDSGDAALAALAMPFFQLGAAMSIGVEPGTGAGGVDRLLATVGSPSVFFPGEVHRLERDEGAASWSVSPAFYTNPTGDRSFGRATASSADGSIVVVGAPEAASSMGSFAGDAFAFDPDLSGGLPASVSGASLGTVVYGSGGAPAGSEFGQSLAADGDLVFVGAPGEGTGRVYVFERNGGPGSGWSLDFTLTPAAGSGFGADLVFSNDRLFAARENGGREYVEYEPSGNAWIATGEVLVGESLVVDGDRALLGGGVGSFPDLCADFDVFPAQRDNSGSWIVGAALEEGASNGGGVALASTGYLLGSQSEFDCCPTIFGCPVASSGEVRLLCCDPSDCDGNGVPDWIEGSAGGAGPTFDGALFASAGPDVCPGTAVILATSIDGVPDLVRWYRADFGGANEQEIGQTTGSAFALTVGDGSGGTQAPGEFFARLLAADNACLLSDEETNRVDLDLIAPPVAGGTYSASPAIQAGGPPGFQDFIEICDGSSLSITFTGGGPTLDWTHESLDLTTAPGVTISGGPGFSTLTVAAVNASFDGLVNAFSTNPCGELVSHGTIDLRRLPVAALAATPPSSSLSSPVCPGTDVTLTADLSGTIELVRWYRSDVGGGNESQIGTSTDATFDLTVGGSGSAPGEFFARLLAADHACLGADLESGRTTFELLAPPDESGTYSASPAIQLDGSGSFVEVCEGETLSVTLTTTGPVVTWTHTNLDLTTAPGVTITSQSNSSTLTIAAGTAAFNGSVFATTGNSCGASFDYSPIELRVSPLADETGTYAASPAIEVDGSGSFVQVCEGDPLSVTLTTSGPEVVWTHSSLDLTTTPGVTIVANASGSTLSFASATAAFEGTVFATTQSSCGSTFDYAAIDLRVAAPPEITAQSSNPAAAGSGEVEVDLFGGATFQISTTGDDLEIAWLLNGLVLPGATTEALAIQSFPTAGIQTVSAEVSNDSCTTATATFVVNVDGAQTASSVWTAPGDPDDFDVAGNWDSPLVPEGNAILANQAGSSENLAEVTTAQAVQSLSVSSPVTGVQVLELTALGTVTTVSGTDVGEGGELRFTGGTLTGPVDLAAGATMGGFGSSTGPLVIAGPTCSAVPLNCVTDFDGSTYGILSVSGGSLFGLQPIASAGRIEVAAGANLQAPLGLSNTEGRNDTELLGLVPRGVRLTGGTLTLGATQGTDLGDCPPATGHELANGERGDVRGHGSILGDVRNAGRLVSSPDSVSGTGGIAISGRLDAEGGAVPQTGWEIHVEASSTLSAGELGTTCGAGVLTLADASSALEVTGDLTLGPDTWVLPGAGQIVAGGDVSFRSSDGKHVLLSNSRLRLEGTGATPLQELEVAGVELGTQGNLALPNLFAFAEVEVGPTPTSVQLVDLFVSGGGGGVESLYADRLIVRSGSSFSLGGLTAHVGELVLEAGATLDVTGGTLFYETSTLGAPCGGGATVIGDDGDCATGTGLAIAPAADCDGNGTPDAIDIANGVVSDCNGNGVPDSCDVLSGASLDQLGDGVPDDCQTFFVDCEELSISVGGSQTLRLEAGPANAGNLFLIAGSATGTTPGIPLDGVVLPLAFDAYTNLTGSNPNGAFLAPGFAFLDGTGAADSTFAIPGGLLGPQLAGAELFHAYVTLTPFGLITLASNATKVRFLP